jgi:uncharacterized membrane protein (UPF0182 family)
VSFEQEPRRDAGRPVVARRRRGALAPTLIILGVLIVLVLLFAEVWTEALWYRQLGFLRVYQTELVFRTLLFLFGMGVMAGGVGSSMVLAYRARPIYAPISTEQAGLDRYRDGIEPLRRIVLVVVPLGLGLFAGSATSQQWRTLLLWLNRVPFGRKDAQFHIDIGFFVFTLPWLQFLAGFVTAVIFLAGLTALVTHYLYGGLRLQGAGPRMTPAARVHLGVLAAAFLLMRAVDYWLSRYALTTKDSRQEITGLTYTDANAVLTAKAVLAAIALIVAALFVVAAVADRFRLLPLYGVGLLVVSAIVIGGIYPAVVQRFQVTPSAKTLETKYIQRNIVATRDAYGLTGLESKSYNARTVAQAGALRNDAETIPGIRLLDPSLVADAFRQLEQNKQYYTFPDSLDVDRYRINGATRDTVIAVRDVDIDRVPPGQRNWYNDHLLYTHGFGVVAAYGNKRSEDGKPVFFQSGIPSKGELGNYQPRVYFGEDSPDYSIVGGTRGSTPQELDYPDDSSPTGQQNFTYNGKGGVPIGSTFRQVLYAIKFREQNVLLSSGVNSDSRILFDRDPRTRVQKVAPYLTLDGDPYPAVVDGRIKWILDGYTTTSRYPYSRTETLSEATADSITATSTSVVPLQAQRVNYIRNSVKATVDAFDGSVTLYAWDGQDPVLKAWRKVFPATVRPLSQIDGQLMSHLRYPEDLFKVQRQLLTRYHVTDGGAFFGGQDFWRVPNDPTESGAQFQPPYYLTLQMPSQDAPSFSITSTFIPAGTGRNVLTGFLAVDSDAGSIRGKKDPQYGKMRLLQLPREAVVPGPGQVQNNFNANPTVSQQLNLLRQGSSRVEPGNLLTLPLGGGLLYVQPVYVRGNGDNSYPLLQKVLVAFGDQIGFADTLDEALDEVFQGNAGAPPTEGETPPSRGTATTPSTSSAEQALEQALAEANAALQDSQAALRAGDFAAYGVAQQRLSDAIQRAIDAQAQIAATSSTASPSPSPTAGRASPSPTGTG